MLWSLIRIVLFIAAIAAMAIGASWLMDTGGGVRIAVADTEFNLGPLQAAVAVIALIVAVWLFLALAGILVAVLRFLNGDETAISRHFDRNRERRGFAALTEGIVAIAAGDSRTALAKAAKAEKYLDRPELTSLVLAQAAEVSGDGARAEAAYRRLLANETTRFVGIRGLLKQRIAAGDTATALVLARHAFALKPRHTEVQDQLLALQAQSEDWKGARQTLAEKLRHGALPRDVHRRRDAVLALGEAREVFREGNTIEAREAAIEANRLSPDLIPAAVMAARGYAERGDKKLATRVLKKAWESRPHPDLAAAFAALEPDETPEQRLLRFQSLTKRHAEDPETRQLVAELSIAAGDFPAARRAVGALVETDPTARSLALMAAIERGEGADDAIVRGWLAKALTAPRGPQWVCDTCHHVAPEWGPVCASCGGFDTLSWRRAETAPASLPGAAEMLPVIVGTPVEPLRPPEEPPPPDYDPVRP
jgi:HemY protein